MPVHMLCLWKIDSSHRKARPPKNRAGDQVTSMRSLQGRASEYDNNLGYLERSPPKKLEQCYCEEDRFCPTKQSAFVRKLCRNKVQIASSKITPRNDRKPSFFQKETSGAPSIYSQ